MISKKSDVEDIVHKHIYTKSEPCEQENEHTHVYTSL
jgi:hypothetical protein